MAIIALIAAAAAFWVTYHFGYRYKGFIYNTLLLIVMFFLIFIVSFCFAWPLSGGSQRHLQVTSLLLGHAVIGSIAGMIWKIRVVKKSDKSD